ncbi:tol-pal system protein YbgF [Celeribacter arenosi]|uniref:Cell division coordinator CpoB n=1 Tax=Celeribacter arenosi TaxID=792649 RepID=A0ABP7K9J6_9RHOB
MKRLIAVFWTATCLSGGLGGALWAQDTQTLADIRQEAAVLSVELARLKQELSTTGAPNTAFAGGSTLERVDLMEAALQRLTAKTEELEFRIESVVRDGTNQLDDINFRLCELEAGCDIANLPPLKPIGGASATTDTVTPIPAPAGEIPMEGGGELALSEKTDYDAAMALYQDEQYTAAAEAFGTFAQNYTGGFLTGEAHFMRGEALARAGDTTGAARAYLDSFSGAPEGDRAPTALLRLGTSLASLGQLDKGCVMLLEVGNRFAGSPEADEAAAARTNLGCP